MGSGLLRNKHELNDDGTTKWNFDVPTLTLNGTKDGLFRVTRVAEAWWHQYENIQASQKDMFPIYVFEGTSHMSYLTGDAPSNVRKHDLKPAVEEDKAHQMIATQIMNYIGHLTADIPFNTTASDSILKPLVDAMVLEGHQNLKPPC